MISKPRHHHHKQLIAFTIVGAVSLTIGAIAVTSYTIVRASFLQQVQEKVFLKVFEQTDVIDHWLGAKKAQVETLAASPIVRQMSWQQAEPYLLAEVARIKDLFVLQIATPGGQIYNTRNRGLVQNRNIRDRVFFQRAMQGHTHINDPVIGRTSKIPVINIGSPIRSLRHPDAPPVGVFSGAVKVDCIREVISPLSYGTQSYAFILDSEGRPIIHPDPALMGTLEKPAPSLLQSNNPELQTVAQRMVHRERGIKRLLLNGEPRYIAFLPLKEAQWSVAIVISSRAIEQEVWLLDILASIMGGLLLAITIVVIRQIQMAHQAKQRLELFRDTQQRLQSILDNSPAIIYVTDIHHRYLLVNRAYEQLIGQSHHQIVGKQIQELWPPETSQVFVQHCEQVLETFAPIEIEEVATLDNQVLTFLTVKFPLYSITGSVYAVCGISTDVTERIKAETALRATNHKLEKTNAELARATRLKDEFLAMMSHELRTPLNAILGLSEGLQEQVFGPLNPRQHRTIETIERSGKHLLELINDILDLTKIESGKLELQLSTTSIQQLCEFSLSFVQQQAQKKQISLNIQIAADVAPEIFVDERRMRQVLINLLNNAVKFTPEGGQVTLTVSTMYRLDQSPPMQELQFAVHDTGIGIAPTDLDKLFKPFVQIDSSLSRQHNGTGLGLTLVSRLIQLHGGHVLVHSEVGQGSCFMVHLPYDRITVALPAPVVETV